MIAGAITRRANKRFRNWLTLLAIAHGSMQSAPQAFAQGFGHHQTPALKALYYPMWQRGNTHLCGNYLD